MLGHLRVLDLTDGGAMLAGQLLGELGAEVILVEPPGGAAVRGEGPFYHDDVHRDRSLGFWALNRDKQSIVIDLESEGGRSELLELARTADFVIESFAPGYLGERGLGYEALSAVNPALVVVSITPFGQTGPKAGWAASDLTIWAASRTMMITGDDDKPPLGLAVPQAWLHGGAEAAVGALIAHHEREGTGRGQHVDVSVQAAAAMASQGTILDSAWSAPETSRVAGGVKFGGIPLRFVNPALDGFVSVTFLFGSAIGPFSRRLMEVLCEEGFVDEATRDKDWLGYTMLLATGKEPLSEYMRCAEAIAAWTSGHTKAELLRMGMEKGLLIVPVSTMADVAHSPQLEARDFWEEVEHPELGRTVRYPGAFAKLSARPMRTRLRPPLLGEHQMMATAARAARAIAPGGGGGKPPLAGLKVLDAMWVIAGPWGTRYLADYGATVVKIESTTRVDTLRTIGPFKDGSPGAERSGGWANINAGKFGLNVSLTNPGGRELVERLVRWADVVTESFTPGTMARLGLGYEDLRALNPGVIMVSSCLNGQSGPYATLAGFGTMGSQIAGFGMLAGWPGRAPAGAAGAYTDYLAPKFTASAILAALDHRRRTGEGQYIDISQAEASTRFLGPALLDYTVNGRLWDLRGNDTPLYFPHGVYPAAGVEGWVAIAVTADGQWPALCRVIGRPEWGHAAGYATQAGRRADGEAIDGAIAAYTSAREPGEIEEALQAAGVPCHRALDSAAALVDPQLGHRGHFVTVPHPELGDVVVENSRMLFSRTPAQVSRPAPTFGQDTDYVLRELLAMSDDEIVEVIASGALE